MKAVKRYLDIGILDTMKDLLVNFIGAIVFCTFGFIYLHSDSKGTVLFDCPVSVRL